MSVSSEETSSASPLSASGRFHAEVRQNLWHNFIAHTVEGGLFMAGIAFVSPETVLPAMVETLGAPDWVIAFMPMAMFMGFSLPPLLTAHWVERLRRIMPFVLVTGVFQRLPFLGAGLVLWFVPEGHGRLVLAAVALAPFLSGVFGGISSSAWQELIARTITPERRSSLWAVRQIIQSAVGMAAGGVIALVLAEYPSRRGFAILHFILFGFLVISYAIFSRIRETEAPDSHVGEKRDLLENLRSLPDLLREDARLRRFVGVMCFSSGMYVAMPFLAIHALSVMGRPDSFLGYLVTAQMVGAIVGNVFLGWLGDRRGGRIVLVIARSLFLAVCTMALFVSNEAGFLAVFVLFGMSFAGHMIGRMTLAIDLSPVGRRPTYLALIQAMRFFSMLLAAGVSSTLRAMSSSFTPVAIVSILCMAVTLIFLAGIREPRGEG